MQNDLDPKGLLPCPFCGGDVVMTELDDEDERRFWVRYVVCENCDTRMRGWTGWPPKGVPFDRQVMSDEVEVSLSAAWNRRHLSAVPAGDGEPVGYIRPETLAKLREGDAGPIVGVAAFDTVIPLYAASRLSQGTWPDKPTPAMRDALRIGSRADVPSDELCNIRYAALIAALSGDTL